MRANSMQCWTRSDWLDFTYETWDAWQFVLQFLWIQAYTDSYFSWQQFQVSHIIIHSSCTFGLNVQSEVIMQDIIIIITWNKQ